MADGVHAAMDPAAITRVIAAPPRPTARNCPHADHAMLTGWRAAPADVTHPAFDCRKESAAHPHPDEKFLTRVCRMRRELPRQHPLTGLSRGVSEGTRTPDRLDHNRIPRDFLGRGQSLFAGSSWFELLALLLKLMDKLMDAPRAKAELTISASFSAGA